MVRVRSGADTDPEPILESLRARRGLSGAKLDGYLAARDDMLRGRTEAQFLETARRVGPYLTVTAGIALERAHQAWIDETIASLMRDGEDHAHGQRGADRAR
jgi:Virulence activator alpha C-term